jgi:hypothetical protein
VAPGLKMMIMLTAPSVPLVMLLGATSTWLGCTCTALASTVVLIHVRSGEAPEALELIATAAFTVAGACQWLEASAHVPFTVMAMDTLRGHNKG